MSGEEASSSGADSGSGGARIPYDYNSTISKHEKSVNHNKPPMFNVTQKCSLGGNPRCIVTL